MKMSLSFHFFYVLCNISTTALSITKTAINTACMKCYVIREGVFQFCQESDFLPRTQDDDIFFFSSM